MKKFFKVVIVSTMGLLFVMTNDVLAAAEGSAETPPSELVGLLAPALDRAFEASGQGALPPELSPNVWKFLRTSALANLGGACKATRAISASKIRTMTVPEFGAHVIMPRPFDETRALRITANFTDSQEAVEGVLRGIWHIPNLEAISLDFDRFRYLTPAIFSLIEAIGPRLKNLTIKGSIRGTLLPDTFLPALTSLKSLNLRCITLSEATLGQLIAKIDGGMLRHVEYQPLLAPSPMCLPLWQHIVRSGSTCDLESQAKAHQYLSHGPGGANPHAQAILDLGLPEGNDYVRWALQKLAGEHDSTRSVPTHDGIPFSIGYEYAKLSPPHK